MAESFMMIGKISQRVVDLADQQKLAIIQASHRKPDNNLMPLLTLVFDPRALSDRIFYVSPVFNCWANYFMASFIAVALFAFLLKPMLPQTLPRIPNNAEFQINPLTCMENSRRLYGDIVAFSDGRPIFSRLEKCVGCVALFGAYNNRMILTAPERFIMPMSLSKRNNLPSTLVNLNASLFSMNGDQHRRNQRLLEKVLNAKQILKYQSLILPGCEEFLSNWGVGQVVPLYSEMRRLALHVSGRVFFGAESDQFTTVGMLIQDYFNLRRQFSSVDSEAQQIMRPKLINLGNQLDKLLRKRVQFFRSNSEYSDSCILSLISTFQDMDGTTFEEDEMVAHANILFTSSSEPVAVTLTWALLLLSQFPDVRDKLVDEIKMAWSRGNAPDLSTILNLGYLDCVLRETLRLLPPNAIMVRATAASTKIGEHVLPGQCEILLSPYVSHRDPSIFPEPNRFDPNRWEYANPSPFEFFPFGVGARLCLGKFLANYIIKVALIHILNRYELILDNDQPIDWAMNINLIPTDEPLMRINHSFSNRSREGGRIMGAVAELIGANDV